MPAGYVFLIILVAAGFFVLRLLLSRGLNKGADAIERAIRKDAAATSDDLLGTAVIFETTAPLSDVRQAITGHVPIVDKIGHKMKLLDDKPGGISWSIGLPSMGNGAVVVLLYVERESGVAAKFEVTQHATNMGTISPFTKQLTELRNQVIAGFKSIDPEVRITADTKEVKYKMSWF